MFPRHILSTLPFHKMFLRPQPVKSDGHLFAFYYKCSRITWKLVWCPVSSCQPIAGPCPCYYPSVFLPVCLLAVMIAATCSNVSLTDLVRYLHPCSGELTRLKETLHWHILPGPAKEVRTLKSRMNSIAEASWPPEDNCWSPWGSRSSDFFCLGTQPQKNTAA